MTNGIKYTFLLNTGRPICSIYLSLFHLVYEIMIVYPRCSFNKFDTVYPASLWSTTKRNDIGNAINLSFISDCVSLKYLD